MDNNFRLADIYDYSKVVSMYTKSINHMIDNGIYQWDEIYPNKHILKRDIENNELYVYTINNEIASSIVLNSFQNKEYSEVRWKNKDNTPAVIHRLCVSVDYQNMGIGKLTITEAEKVLQNKGYKSIRLDAFSLNPYALKMYNKLGYKERGTVKFRKGMFYVFEKDLQ